jgi:hypothetical protein
MICLNCFLIVCYEEVKIRGMVGLRSLPVRPVSLKYDQFGTRIGLDMGLFQGDFSRKEGKLNYLFKCFFNCWS